MLIEIILIIELTEMSFVASTNVLATRDNKMSPE